MEKKRLKIIIFAMVVAMALLAAGLFRIESARLGEGTSRDGIAGTGVDAGDAERSDADARADTDGAAGETDGDAEDARPLATVFFASDYQAEDGFDAPAETLRSVIKSAEAGGKDINGAVMCGDYTNEPGLHDYQLSPDESIEEIRDIVQDECPGLEKTAGEVGSAKSEAAGTKTTIGDADTEQDSVGVTVASSEMESNDILFVQGNHDRMTDEISETGLHDCGNYLVYILNTEEAFPWKQGKTMGCLAKVKKSSAAMKECFDDLISKGEPRPVFIAGHVPLHFTARTSSMHTTGDNLYSSLVFDVVNEAAKDLDIVYLFGHNHSKGWDCYMGGSCVYKTAGDTLLLPEFSEQDISTDTYSGKKLNFTYMNAGYTGYYMNCSSDEVQAGELGNYHAADETLTGTVIEVYPDRLEISRWDAGGEHDIGSAGAADPYKGGIDAGLIPEDAYSIRRTSPQQISFN